MRRLSIKEALHKFARAGFICGVIAVLLCWFMKSFGFDYFELDLDNKFFNDLDTFLGSYKYLKDAFILILLNMQMYLMYCVVNKAQGKKVVFYLLKLLPLTILYRLLSIRIGNPYSMLIDFIFLLLVISKCNYKLFLKCTVFFIYNIAYQAISANTRSLELRAHSYTFVASQILYVDYYILLYLSKELEVNIVGNDGTFFFFGFTAWLYAVAGFIVGLFTLHPIKTAKKWYAIGKAKENARKTKKALRRHPLN